MHGHTDIKIVFVVVPVHINTVAASYLNTQELQNASHLKGPQPFFHDFNKKIITQNYMR
jgi:hypothetical protein